MRPQLFKPFQHQADVLQRSADDQYFAVFWEQGTGKTKLMLDNIVHLARRGEIDAVLILAPNGVHRNWITDEIPKHLPSVARDARYWTSSKAANKGFTRDFTKLLESRFPVVAMSYNAFMTKRGRAWSKKFLTGRDVLMILDESTAIKSPGAKRTMTICAAGKYAKYRRILTGTPVTNGPFDVYAPMRFLDPYFWKQHGFPTFAEFKLYFGIWEKGFNNEQNRYYDFVVGYRNLSQLQGYLAPVSSRVTKDEVLDLPPKLYAKRYFDLTDEQRRVYREIKEEAMTFLAGGEMVDAPLAITRLLRAQQVTCNYLPTEIDAMSGEVTTYTDISDPNPRLRCLEELLAEVSHQAIIWARFRRDIDQIMALLGDRAVRYDGAVSDDGRAESKQRFQDGGVQFFVANPAAGAMGLTLTGARTVIYYNNSFHLEHRLQSEDRAHRIGQEHPVEYVDIMATDTVDVHITKALRSKFNIAGQITGDELKEWI